MELGVSKGEVCNRDECKGIINEHEKEGSCSCHIHPPCGHCESDTSYCPVCEWNATDERNELDKKRQEENKNNGSQGMYNRMMDAADERRKKLQARMSGELPIEKFECEHLSHTHFSQILRGVYPNGMTSEQVRKEVNGTFGGRFTRFSDGVFEFIAYTD